MSQIKINIYRDGSAWFGARWIDGDYDGCDELPCDGDVSAAEAIECAEQMPLAASGDRTVTRVSAP